jgi:hypothetical protein
MDWVERVANRTPHTVDVTGGGRSSAIGEQIPWDGDLGHLERDIAAMADDVDGLSSTAS